MQEHFLSVRLKYYNVLILAVYRSQNNQQADLKLRHDRILQGFNVFFVLAVTEVFIKCSKGNMPFLVT